MSKADMKREMDRIFCDELKRMTNEQLVVDEIFDIQEFPIIGKVSKIHICALVNIIMLLHIPCFFFQTDIFLLFFNQHNPIKGGVAIVFVCTKKHISHENPMSTRQN